MTNGNNALPTLSKLLSLDKFDLTYSQQCDYITLYNHAGKDVAINQAKEFKERNKKAGT